MTREEALKILKDCRRRGFDRTTYYVDEYHTARDMAIRALEEQETVTEFADRCRECGREKVLDKIRAEINALPNANPSYWHSGDMVDRDDVLEIIDKHNAESEEV